MRHRCTSAHLKNHCLTLEPWQGTGLLPGLSSSGCGARTHYRQPDGLPHRRAFRCPVGPVPDFQGGGVSEPHHVACLDAPGVVRALGGDHVSSLHASELETQRPGSKILQIDTPHDRKPTCSPVTGGDLERALPRREHHGAHLCEGMKCERPCSWLQWEIGGAVRALNGLAVSLLGEYLKPCRLRRGPT
jgi:hypothetical protein